MALAGMQMPLFTPDVDYTPPKISDLPSWKDAGRVSVDVETRDDQIKTLGPGVRRGGYICGYSFAIEDGPAHYVPICHAGGDNVENPKAAFQYLRDQAKIFTGDICGAGIQYDLDYLAEQKIIFKRAKWFRDCQVAEPLLDENQFSYSLDNIAIRRGLPGKDETMLRDAAQCYGVNHKDGLWKLPARYVAEYGIQDAKLPLQLLRRQEREIDEQNLWEVYNLESRLLPVLVKMRRRGVKIDFDRLDQIELWATQEEQEKLDEIFHITGIKIQLGDVWKKDILKPAIEYTGQKVQTSSKGKLLIDNELLKGMKHPVGDALFRARKVNKLRTTFAESVRTHAIGDRIHCTFNQLRKTDDGTDKEEGARYGRLSCTLPNLQQQPKRDDFSKRWRSIYRPDDGDIWSCNDFSQQEPRWLVHYAETCHLNPNVKFNAMSAMAAAEAYRNDPSTDSHTMMARMVYGLGPNEMPTEQQRDNSKTVYLGICYGMGGGKMCRRLGLPTKWIFSRRWQRDIEVAGSEGQAILDMFNHRAPFVKQMAQLVEGKASRNGYITTISGRRCRFPANVDGTGFDWGYKALNRLIQGSSGDQTKMAMVLADEADFKIQLQVHDELDHSAENNEEAKALGKLMRESIQSNVPFKVDTEVGESWGQVKKAA